MNVSTLVFLGLAVVWAIVLLPEVLRKLSGVRSSDTIRSFNQQLAVLGRSGSRRAPERRAPSLGTDSYSNVIDLGSRTGGPARPVATPRPVPASVRRRRQEVLMVLGAAAVLTLLCTVAFGGLFLVLHLLADAMLITYIVMLAKLNQATAARGVERSVAGSPLGGMERATVGRPVPAARRIAN